MSESNQFEEQIGCCNQFEEQITTGQTLYDFISFAISYYYIQSHINKSDEIQFLTSCRLSSHDFISDTDELHTCLSVLPQVIKLTYKEKQFKFSITQDKITKFRFKESTFINIISIFFDDYNIYKELLKKFKNIFNEKIGHKKKHKQKLSVQIPDQGHWDYSGLINKRDLKTVCVDEKIKNSMKITIETFLKPETEQRYADLGKRYCLGFLLQGPPGTGKTSLIHALASHFNRDICLMNQDKNMSDSRFTTLFKRVGKEDVLVIEDIDGLLKNSLSEESDGSNISLSSILQCLDGFGSTHGLIYFITTNNLKQINPKVIRPGRIDHYIEIKELSIPLCEKMILQWFGQPVHEIISYIKAHKIKITGALLQYYLSNYDTLDALIDNLDKLKEINELVYDSQEQNLYL